MKASNLLIYKSLPLLYLLFCKALICYAQPVASEIPIEAKLQHASHDTLRARILLDAGTAIMQTNNLQAMEYFDKALEFSFAHNNHSLTAKIYSQLGTNYINQGHPKKALEYFSKALELRREHHLEKELVISYNHIGKAYFQQDRYAKALENYIKSLELAEKLADSSGITHSLNNIAIIHSYQGNQHKALDYLQRSHKIFTLLQDKKGVASSYSNIANIYDELEMEAEALNYYQQALKIFEEIKDIQGLARVYNNLGHMSDKLNQHIKAQLYYKSALNLFTQFGDLKGQALACSNIGESYIKTHQLDEAKQYLDQGFAIAQSIDTKEILHDLYLHFSRLYRLKEDFENAYEYHLLYAALKDSIYNESNSRQIAEMAFKYEADSKEKEIQLLNTSRELQRAEIIRQKLIRNFLAGLAIMTIVLSAVLYRSNRIRRNNNKELHKLNQAIYQQKEELTTQRDYLETLNNELHKNKLEITRQKDDISQKNITLELAFEEIEKKNDRIMSSLQYAQRIQGAIMAAYTRLQHKLPEHFIFFQPREIVSGDFYWFAEKDNLLYIAVLDCTGHGVPGAIMSMVGGMVLDQIISEKQITDPGKILQELHRGINKALSQEDSGSRDGMDAGLCVLDKQAATLSYAGAKIPLYYVQHGELCCLPGGRHSLGGKHTVNGGAHQTHTVPITTETTIYLFTDGYPDQFGGPHGKKFMIKRLRELLQSIHHLPMSEQKAIIVAQFEEWKGEQEQIDDVLIAGFKILPNSSDSLFS